MISNATTISLEGRLITPARLEQIMDVAPCTVIDWNKKKLISHFRKGRLIRYTPENVLQFILKNTVVARGVGMNIQPSTIHLDQLSGEAWGRIERLIADQVEARFEARIVHIERKDAA